MLTLEQLKQVVHKKGITKTDAALLCVAGSGATSVQTAAVRKIALAAGVKGASKIHFSAHLHSAEDKVFKTVEGWELTNAGRAHVAALAAEVFAISPAAKEAQELRKLLPKIRNAESRAFLAEAIVCAEQSLFRAAVVLSWVGAMSILHDVVLSKHLIAFNAEASKRNPKWKAAKNADELGVMKESAFLEIIQVISVIGKNVKQELDVCLQTRNGCGHPNSLKIGANKVAAHLEILLLNVYAKFG